ncbi:hypothetical protein [Roseomonas sp. HF4]|uniref:hypothetical protein n=1 Tax=Roseomonas sp. HF4 TaxID=2562313 RepID=UPI0010C0AA01|nr:hypothetical protein [Roseomonas sp. HF4]
MRRWTATALLLLTALAAAPAAAGDWHRPAPGYGYGQGWQPAPAWHHPYRFAPPRYDRRDWRHRGHGWHDERRDGGWRRHDERRHARPW